MMVKLSNERRWLFNRFPQYGWSIGDPSLMGIKRWDVHKDALVRDGLLEKDEYGMFRVTDVGRDVLSKLGEQ